MRIQHNIMAMNAYRNYTNNVSAMKKNLERLSSGYKINRAGDDAAGLAISEKMRAQITGLETAQKNAKDGISLVQTAEGALTEVHDMLNRMVELATQSANGTYDDGTDRYQLQKEVNQLLDEINRIADSSNFNGINLLDGTLGLNTSAFTDFTSAAYTDGKLDVSKVLTLAAEGTQDKSILHLETASATAQAPSATIDLGDLKLHMEKGESGSLTINIGNMAVTVTFAKNDSSATTKTAADIGTELIKKLKEKYGAKTSDGTADLKTDAAGIRIGDAVYTLTGTTQITLTYAGHGTDSYKKDASGFTGDTDCANSINSDLGFHVTVSANSGTIKGDVIHDAVSVTQARAEADAGKAGIDITLSADLLKQGFKLIIDGKEFVFQTEKNAPSNAGSATVINLYTDYVSKGVTGDDLIHAAVDELSKQTFTGSDSRTWKISSKDGQTIHIDQTASSAAGKELKTYADLTGIIKVKGVEQNATTTFTVTNGAIKKGNVISITDGTTTKKYMFAEDAKDVPDGYTFVSMEGDAAQNLATAIGSSATLNDGKITVTASSKDANAPTVLGKGLTLQIGDTSDSFNQLNVAVQDCHVANLGIEGLDISSAESAQLAIADIKNAINMVSDVRGTLGATQNRLDHTINNLSVMTENIQDAESTIRDTDIAEEMMAYTKNNILIQSAQAMLAQANQVPQGVLQLLQ